MWQDCVAGDLSSGISFRSAGTHTSSSFLFLPGTFPLRTFHFVATRIIFFLSVEIKKHLLGRGR